MELKHTPPSEFFNTTHLEGNDLKKEKELTGTQNAKVLAVFFANKKASFNAWQVRARIGARRIMIGSVRRAIDTLYNKGMIKCTGQNIGFAGKVNFTYKFKKA